MFRASQSEFVIQLSKYIKAVFHTRISVGMRFRMLFETEESSVRRWWCHISGNAILKLRKLYHYVTHITLTCFLTVAWGTFQVHGYYNWY